MSKSTQKIIPQKKPITQDWHPADIKAELEKAGWSLQQLSLQHGYVTGSLRMALRNPWPKAEAIIAAAIGHAPNQIWPSRYGQNGNPKSGRGERGLGRYQRKATTANKEKSTISS